MPCSGQAQSLSRFRKLATGPLEDSKASTVTDRALSLSSQRPAVTCRGQEGRRSAAIAKLFA